MKHPKFLDFFAFLVHFEILSNYPNFDSSLWLREHVQCITEENFKEKLMV